jgi:hypothetical protein
MFPQMAIEPSEIKDTLGTLLGGIAQGILSGFKLGPGALGNISTVNVVGLVAVMVAVYALRDHPVYALACIALVIIYLMYSSERGYRFARSNRVEALLGSAEVYQITRDQMGARDPSIILDASPTSASMPSAPKPKSSEAEGG